MKKIKKKVKIDLQKKVKVKKYLFLKKEKNIVE